MTNHKPIANQKEFFQNWYTRLDLLCKSHYEIGMIGSAYFLGLVIMIIPIPIISDQYGRRKVLLAAIMVSLVAQTCLLFVQTYNQVLFLMVIIGICFPARTIVGLDYMLELLPQWMRIYAILFVCIYVGCISFFTALFF